MADRVWPSLSQINPSLHAWMRFRTYISSMHMRSQSSAGTWLIGLCARAAQLAGAKQAACGDRSPPVQRWILSDVLKHSFCAPFTCPRHLKVQGSTAERTRNPTNPPLSTCN